MKLIRKYFYWAILTLVFGAIFLLGFLKSGDLPRFYITSDSHTEVISTYNAEDGNYYVFLPAYAELDDVTVEVPYFQPVTLDGIALENGMDCSRFQLETPYELHYKRTTATLWFYKSAGVATMYINTRSGSMDYIHSNKDYTENSSVSLFGVDGEILCLNQLSTIKGRGNSTWESEKRPYALTLSSEKDLLGMGSAANWVLLANAYDETNLNNKLIFNLASRLEFQWVPESCYVDLYLNGEYNGLYLLSEKVEVHKNRLNINAHSGDFLCKIDLPGRMAMMRNPIITETNRSVEIIHPRVLSDSEILDLKSKVNEIEKLLLSGSDLSSEPGVDLDSWVRRYLIDEIFGNIDADHASGYFYYSGSTCFAGPVWDYDLTFGNDVRNQYPYALIARNGQASVDSPSPYYHALYSNKSFYNRMVEIYRTEFLPLLHEILDREVDSVSNTIAKASQQNRLRWKAVFDAQRNAAPYAVHTADALKRYYACRIEFLNALWLESKTFYTVQFENPPTPAYWNICVEEGSHLNMAYVDDPMLSANWINAETGEPFDLYQPITEDIVLTQHIAKDDTADKNPAFTETVGTEPAYSVRFLLVLFSAAALFVLFTGAAAVDIVHRHHEKRLAQGRAKASPQRQLLTKK